MKDTTGGAAFPNAGGQKFLRGNDVRVTLPSDGMTLRDYFAAKAMAAYASNEHGLSDLSITRLAYSLADAMLKERDK